MLGFTHKDSIERKYWNLSIVLQKDYVCGSNFRAQLLRLATVVSTPAHRSRSPSFDDARGDNDQTLVRYPLSRDGESIVLILACNFPSQQS